jgi:hypothetical protein
MTDDAQLLYLEPDDEITSVVRRLREADASRVVLVTSGRSKSTTSAVALRLLAQVAAEEEREIALVADAASRALAGEAGIPAFASVADAHAEHAPPVDAVPARRAPIHVVRGQGEPAPGDATPAAPAPITSAPSGRGDETQAVPLPPAPAPAARRAVRRRTLGGQIRWRRLPPAAFAALIALLLAAGALLAAVAPAATIVITRAGVAVGPVDYPLTVEVAGRDQGELTASAQGTATGVHTDPSAAAGVVTFLNWNTVTVEVPAGTVVSADKVRFATTATIVVPAGRFGLPIDPGENSVAIAAEEAGPGGNVAAEAIDTIETNNVRNFLRGFPNNPNRLVVNLDPTAGGAVNEQPQVVQADVDAAVTALRADLAAQLEQRLAEDEERVYPAQAPPEPVIGLPDGLVGTIGEASFELTGTLAYDRPYARREAVIAQATAQLLDDPGAAPAGTEVVEGSVEVAVGAVTMSGAALRLDVSVSAEALPVVDANAVREQVAGLSGPEAADRLDELGDVSVTLWPDWVDRVPALGWRVDVQVTGTEPGPSESAAE